MSNYVKTIPEVQSFILKRYIEPAKAVRVDTHPTFHIHPRLGLFARLGIRLDAKISAYTSFFQRLGIKLDKFFRR